MNIFTRHKNILLIVIGLVLVFFGYWYFFLSKKTPQVQNSTGGALVKTNDVAVSATAGNKKYDKEFVSGLLSLNTINIDTSLFASEAYQALSFPEKPFPVDYDFSHGRQNPFLPIGVRGAGNDITSERSADTSTNTFDTTSGANISETPAQNISGTSGAPVTATTTATTTTAPIKKTFPTNGLKR